jgi:FkbM family methyltransferase
MKRADRIKLSFIRNWNLPGKERLSGWLKPSKELKTTLNNGIIWLNHEDIALYTSVNNYIEYTILSTGTYEDEIGKLIRVLLKPGSVALDIGANIGLQTIRMSASVGVNGQVYSFEPLTYLQKKFTKNITLNNCSNVTLFPLALSDHEEHITVNIDEQTWNQGTFSLKHGDNGTTSQQIDVKAGDKMKEIQDLHQLNLIKIDVEGFEYHVLRGLKASLQKHRPHIIFEYDSNYWMGTGQSIADCYHFLTDLNYTLYQISSVGCELITTPQAITDGNLLGIPKNIK